MENVPSGGFFESIVSEYADVICHLDQVVIYSRQNLNKLEELLPVEELKKHCHHFSVQSSHGTPYHDYGWESFLSFSVPSKEFFVLLNDNKALLRGYIITRVEVAKDIIIPNLSLSKISRLVGKIHKVITLKHSNDFYEFDTKTRNFEDLGGFKSDKGFFTSTLQTKAWALSTYARVSKLTGQNCLHTEWRYLNTGSVKKNLHIRTIDDLARFDPEKYWMGRDSSLCLKEIDRELFGKFLYGIDGRRKLDPLIDQPPSKSLRSLYAKVSLLAEHYLDGINSVIEFQKMFSKMKKDIKKRGGAKTELEERILKRSSRSFLKEISISELDNKRGFCR